MSAGLLAKADRLRLRTARAPGQALCQRPAASSQGTRPGARSCWRLPLFQPPVLAPQPPTGPVERSLKRQHITASKRGAVRWSLAGVSSPPSRLADHDRGSRVDRAREGSVGRHVVARSRGQPGGCVGALGWQNTPRGRIFPAPTPPGPARPAPHGAPRPPRRNIAHQPSGLRTGSV